MSAEAWGNASRVPGWLQKLLAVLTIGLFVVGVAPVFLELAGWRFVPSLEWIERMGEAAVAWGLVLGLLVAWFCFATRESNPKMKGKGPHALLFLCAGFAVFFWLCAYNAILLGWPMARALVSGEEVRLEFAVRRDPGYSDRKCRRKIDLDGLPWTSDRLCFVPAEVFDAAKRGDRLAVIGHGTSDGVFFDDVERLR